MQRSPNGLAQQIDQRKTAEDRKKKIERESVIPYSVLQMAISKASRVPFFLALIVVAAVLVSSCYASTDAPDAGQEEPAAAVEPQADPKCDVMERCNVQICTEYCISIGLRHVGFCTFRDLQFYCCCPVPDPPK